MKRFAAVLVPALSMLSLAGCDGTTTRAPGDFVMLLESPPESLDHRFALSQNGQRVASLIQPGIIEIDDSGQAAPDLAASFELVTPTRYRFHLRPGLTFHDGSPLTADDVVYTFSSMKDPAVGSPFRTKYDNVAGVVAVDPLTIDFELTEPFAPLLLDLNVGIVPARMADPTYRAAHDKHPVGAGPFRFIARPDEEHLELAPFADYYGGRPAIDRLEFVVVRDETTRVLAMLHGDADFLLSAVSPVLLPRLAKARHLQIKNAPGSGYAYLGFNLRVGRLQDPRVRRAIAHAIDRDLIAAIKFKGTATPATGMLPERHWAYGPAARYPFDPALAKRLLDEAGFTDPDGDGPARRFTLSYKTSTDRFRKAIALIIVAQLEAVGIGVDLKAYEWGTFFGDVKRGRFEIISLKWTPVIEPHLMQWVFHSSSIPTEANGWIGGNRGAYQNPEVDRLLDAAALETDPAARHTAYARVQEILGEDLPYVPLWHEDVVGVVSRRFEFDISPHGLLDPLARARPATATTTARLAGEARTMEPR